LRRSKRRSRRLKRAGVQEASSRTNHHQSPNNSPIQDHSQKNNTLTITTPPSTTQDNLLLLLAETMIPTTSDHPSNTVTPNMPTSSVLINTKTLWRSTRMLVSDRSVTTVSCAVTTIHHALSVLLSTRRKPNVQNLLSASWRTRRLNVVDARNTVRDVLLVTWQVDVLNAQKDIGRWVETASRVSGDPEMDKLK